MELESSNAFLKENDSQTRAMTQEEQKINKSMQAYKDTMTLLKLKMNKTDTLIRQYNDKIKECDLLNEDLFVLKNEKQDILNKYNQTMEKITKLELLNTSYKQTIDKYKDTCDKQKIKLDENEQLINQLVFKLDDVKEQNATLEDTTKKLQQEVKSSKVVTKVITKKPNMQLKDAAIQTICPKTQDTSINTDPLKPMQAKPEMKQKYVMTDPLKPLLEKPDTKQKFTMTDPIKIFFEKSQMIETSVMTDPLETVFKIPQMRTKCIMTDPLNLMFEKPVMKEKSIMTDPLKPLFKKPQVSEKHTMTDQSIGVIREPFPIYCTKCLKPVDPAPIEQILKIMSSKPPLLSETISPPHTPKKVRVSNFNLHESYIVDDAMVEENDQNFISTHLVNNKKCESLIQNTKIENNISFMEIDKLSRKVNKLENLIKKTKTSNKKQSNCHENCLSSKNIKFVVKLPSQDEFFEYRKREKCKVKRLKCFQNKKKIKKHLNFTENNWHVESYSNPKNRISKVKKRTFNKKKYNLSEINLFESPKVIYSNKNSTIPDVEFENINSTKESLSPQIDSNSMSPESPCIVSLNNVDTESSFIQDVNPLNFIKDISNVLLSNDEKLHSAEEGDDLRLKIGPRVLSITNPLTDTNNYSQKSSEIIEENDQTIVITNVNISEEDKSSQKLPDKSDTNEIVNIKEMRHRILLNDHLQNIDESGSLENHDKNAVQAEYDNINVLLNNKCEQVDNTSIPVHQENTKELIQLKNFNNPLPHAPEGNLELNKVYCNSTNEANKQIHHIQTLESPLEKINNEETVNEESKETEIFISKENNNQNMHTLPVKVVSNHGSNVEATNNILPFPVSILNINESLSIKEKNNTSNNKETKSVTSEDSSESKFFSSTGIKRGNCNRTNAILSDSSEEKSIEVPLTGKRKKLNETSTLTSRKKLLTKIRNIKRNSKVLTVAHKVEPTLLQTHEDISNLSCNSKELPNESNMDIEDKTNDISSKKLRIAHTPKSTNNSVNTDTVKKKAKVIKRTKTISNKEKILPGDKISSIIEDIEENCKDRKLLVTRMALRKSNNSMTESLTDLVNSSIDSNTQTGNNTNSLTNNSYGNLIVQNSSESNTFFSGEGHPNVSLRSIMSEVKSDESIVSETEVLSDSSRSYVKQSEISEDSVVKNRIRTKSKTTNNKNPIPSRELRSRQKFIMEKCKSKQVKTRHESSTEIINESNSSLQTTTIVSALNHYLNKLNPSSVMVFSKKVNKAGMKKKETLILKQLSMLIEAKEWTTEIHSAVLNTLVNLYDARTIALCIIDYASDNITDTNLDKTHTPPAPMMTVPEQKLITLIMSISKEWSDFIDIIVSGIEYRLFKLGPPHVEEVTERLFRILVVLSKIRKDRQKVRMLCCDALYCLNLRAVNIIYVALICWPEVFPKYDSDNDIILKSIVFAIMTIQVKTPYPKLFSLRKLLSTYYEYPDSGYMMNVFTEELFKNLLENAPGINTAILITCKKMGPAWAYQNIVVKLLQMIIHKIHPSRFVALSLLGNLLRAFPATDPNKHVANIVDQLCDVLDGNAEFDLQEGIVNCLLSISKHNFEQIARSVIKWSYFNDLQPITNEKLNTFFQQRNPKWWWNFVQANYPQS